MVTSQELCLKFVADSRPTVSGRDNREVPSVNNSGYYSDPAADWRTSHVALQHRMGILPQRWAGIGADNRDHPGADGESLRAPGRVPMRL
jgi:hypothetical protein